MRVAFVIAVLGGAPLACAPPRDARLVDAELGVAPAGAARVCVLRPATTASATTMEIRDNDRLVGATRGATFVCWIAAPGDHQIASNDDDTGPTFLAARAGHHYWLHQDVATLGGEIHAHLDWVDDAGAADLLDHCTARVRVAVPGQEERPDMVAVTPKL